MPKSLSPAAIEQFRSDGYYYPVPVLSDAEVSDLRSRLEAVEAAQGGALRPEQRNKAHLLFKWLDDLMRNPRILDPVEDLIGPDILCWNSLFWIKEPRSPSYVSWHQDIRYWGLAGGDVVTAWVALSPASSESGCMRVLPGTHLAEVLPHEDRYDGSNMLTRGQEISAPIDESEAVPMPLRPGEMSLHDVRLAHASTANDSDDRRIGVSFHYVPTRAHQSVGAWDSAALVRGVDEHRHFEHAPRPACDFDPEAAAFHARATEAVRDILYHGAEQTTAKL
jgi:non-heme Fe2+,alpha-ketoglutarate-dependent halogenase